uniref:Uncharacterized protein n=1 Tax=Romanomermis culicivorax TaxID=13658 RepID=A0A915L6Z6_ROMCU
MTDIVSYVVAKYDYVSQDEQELTIRKGERLALLDDSKNWWKVRNSGDMEGFVPSNYVRSETWKDTVKGTLRKLPDLPRKSSQTNVNKQQLQRPSLTNVFSAPVANNNTKLATSSGNSGHQRTSSDSQTSNDRTPTSPLKVLHKAQARYDYEPNREDELRLAKGQYLAVLEQSSDGWWKGVNILSLNLDESQILLVARQDKTGWFPSNYVSIIEEQSCEESNFFTQKQNYSGNTNVVKPKLPQTPSKRNGHHDVNSRTNVDVQNSFAIRQNEDLTPPMLYHRARISPPPGSSSLICKPWYYGRVSRDDSDKVLQQYGVDGDFLIRDSESNVG